MINKDITKWTEVTRGLYREVIAAKVCYEILITDWYYDTPLETAKASLYVVGEWRTSNNGTEFTRELILAENTVQHCIEAAEKDYMENMI